MDDAGRVLEIYRKPEVNKFIPVDVTNLAGTNNLNIGHLRIDMLKQHENPLCICYSTKKSDIGTEVGSENIFNLHLWLG